MTGTTPSRATPPLELPTGTVTFFFSDIEGSTRLLQEFRDAYRSVQDQQAEILRGAIAGAGGTEIRTEGDSFFAAFPTPQQAVHAAVTAQRALARHHWQHGRPLLVRMGLHTGEGVLGGDDYIGIDVNRAARIAAAAWGGQILLSHATSALVEQSLPEKVSIRKLGTHRLKDLDGLQPLFDLVIDGLRADFPPPRTLEVPSNLPVQLTSFVGRDAEVAQAKVLLGKSRLMTITGPGGTGKTRLALQLAAEVSGEFPDGAFFVDLAPVSEPALVVPAIAAGLGIREDGWEHPVRVSLDNFTRDRRLLLVLDNFEQVLDAAPIVIELLEVAPDLKIVVTSRSSLKLRGEQDLPLAPLHIPDLSAPPTLEELAKNEAVALFVERATSVNPSFTLDQHTAPPTVEIIARVDGLPLAIELAASRAAIVGPGVMVERLDRRLPLLVGGPRDLPDRQRTLRATVGWSYDLLIERHRMLFRRLSAMTGGATVEAAATVCDIEDDSGEEVLEGLLALEACSLVQTQQSPTGLRFIMLGTIREFGLERLQAEDDRDRIERRHADWCLELAETAEPLLRGPELLHWWEVLQVEHDNLRGALRGAIERGEANVGLRLVGSLWRQWHLGGLLSEGRRWADSVLSLPAAASRTKERSKGLAGLGSLAYWQNDWPVVRRSYEEALAISRELDDPPGIAEGTYNLAFAHGLVEGRVRARSLFLQSRDLFEQLGNRRGVADSLWGLAMVTRLERDFVGARKFAEESVSRHRGMGDMVGLIDSLEEVGRAAFGMGDLDVARACFLESLAMLGPVGYRTGVAIVLDNLAAQENAWGRPLRAVRLGGAAKALKTSAGGQAPPEFLDLPDPREAARATLSEEQIASAWEEGKAMGFDAAVAYAQGEATELH
jgi:predicted ATPase/class 3 adenylate cyclase